MADVSSTLAAWSSTSASNGPAGSTTIGTGLDDNIRELQGVIVRGLSHKGSDIASVAGTTDIGAVEGLFHDVTGAETITGLGTVRAGIWKVLKFEGAATLTHNATSLILPGGANIVCASGDIVIVASEGSGNWRCVGFFPVSQKPPVRGTFTATLSGVDAAVTGTANYNVVNNIVTVHYPVLTGTSNTTACTITGQPAAIQPTTAHLSLLGITQDNSAGAAVARLDVGTNGVVTLYSSPTSATFTAANVKGIPGGLTITYNLN